MNQVNPLEKYYRQASIYVTLPSKGKYYSEDVFTPTTTGEIPILPMTAKDELAFKTPDAMMNGQSTVDVIRSCVPNLHDPWQMVNYDMDTILLAIRVASYGETMDVNAIVPVINEQAAQTVNLPQLLDSVKNINIRDEAKTTNGFTVKFKPLTYKQITASQLAAYEQQRTYAAIDNSTLSEEEKNRRFSEGLKKLTDLNYGMLVDSIASITTPDGNVVTDVKQLSDFVNNAPSKLMTEIQNELVKVRTQAAFKPLKIASTEDQIKRGAPVNFEVPITFDNSNFFV